MSLTSHKQNINPSNKETNFTPIIKSKKLTHQNRKLGVGQGVKTLKARPVKNMVAPREFKVGSPQNPALLLLV